MSGQVSDGNKMECLTCRKTWVRPKSGTTNLMSYDQADYSPAEIREYPQRLWVIESSAEGPYPTVCNRLREEPNTLEVPTRPKGGRGANPWGKGIPKKAKSDIIARLKGFDYSGYSSFAIPDRLGEGGLRDGDINWLYKNIESLLPIDDRDI